MTIKWPVKLRGSLVMLALLASTIGLIPGALWASAGSPGVTQTFGARSTAAGSSLSASPASATSAGDLLAAVIRTRNITAAAPVSSVSDSNGDSWLKAAASANGPNDGEIWYAPNAASLATNQSVTVTVGGTSPSTTAIAFTALDLSGAALSSPLDVTAVANGNTTAPSTGSSPSTNTANEIVVAGIGWNGNGVTLSNQTAGYTTTGVQQATVSGSYTAEQAAWQMLSATGSQSYSGTLSSSVAWAGLLATFKVGAPPVPSITGFSPSSGPVGTGVTITGSGFTGATAVAFNTTAATYTVTNDSHISATVPSGATTGTITVTAPGGMATSSTSFTVSATPPPPVINGFSPGSGPVDTAVIVTGSAFTGATAVAFNGKSATYSVTDDADISTSVPIGATTGTITVTTLGGTGTSPTQFTVTSPPPAPHVLLVMEENRDYGGIIGNTNAPYINSLVSSYASATSWYAVEHNSPADYLDLISGSNQGVPNGIPFSATTLVDELHSNGIPWLAYMESMPSACYTKAATPDGLYDPSHNPFHYFTTYTTNVGGWCSSGNASSEGILPFPGASGLVAELESGNAPDFVFVTPNDCDDMHGDTNTGSPCASSNNKQLMQAGDTWLMNNIGPVLNTPWFAQNGIIIITWDEGNGNLGCCGLSTPGGHVATVVITPYNAGLGSFTKTGDHFGTLRAIEEQYAVGLLLGSQNTANGDLSGAFAASKGAITGTVTDSTSGAPIAGATVSDGVGPSVLTDSTGAYVLANVSPATATVTVSASGYSSQTSAPFAVTAGATSTQNFALGP